MTFFHKIVLWKPYPIKGIAFFHKIVLWKKPYPIRKVAQRRDLAKKLLSPKVSKIGFYILSTSFQKLYQGPRPHTEHFLENMPITQKRRGLAIKLLSPKVSKIEFYILSISFQMLFQGPRPHTEHFFAKCAYNSKTEGFSKKVIKSKSV